MHILIDKTGALSLEQHNEFKSFSIVDQSPDAGRTALDQIAEPAEDNHYWINAEAVVQLSPLRGNAVWEDSFWKMLVAVEPYGYANLETKKVKAHIEGI